MIISINNHDCALSAMTSKLWYSQIYSLMQGENGKITKYGTEMAENRAQTGQIIELKKQK